MGTFAETLGEGVLYDVQGQATGVPASPAEMQAFMGRIIALEEEMDRAGAFAFGGALHGPDAATVVSGGTGLDKVTTDGPFVEAKERIGGFYIINADDLDSFSRAQPTTARSRDRLSRAA